VPLHQSPYLGLGNWHSEYIDERPSSVCAERFRWPNADAFIVSRPNLLIVGQPQVLRNGFHFRSKTICCPLQKSVVTSQLPVRNCVRLGYDVAQSFLFAGQAAPKVMISMALRARKKSNCRLGRGLSAPSKYPLAEIARWRIDFRARISSDRPVFRLNFATRNSARRSRQVASGCEVRMSQEANRQWSMI
jgi:hypothetical protein